LLLTKYLGIVGVNPSSILTGVSGLPFLFDTQSDFYTLTGEIGREGVVRDRWTGEDTV
jgi:hypothetical protein